MASLQPSTTTTTTTPARSEEESDNEVDLDLHISDNETDEKDKTCSDDMEVVNKTMEEEEEEETDKMDVNEEENAANKEDNQKVEMESKDLDETKESAADVTEEDSLLNGTMDTSEETNTDETLNLNISEDLELSLSMDSKPNAKNEKDDALSSNGQSNDAENLLSVIMEKTDAEDQNEFEKEEEERQEEEDRQEEENRQEDDRQEEERQEEERQEEERKELSEDTKLRNENEEQSNNSESTPSNLEDTKDEISETSVDVSETLIDSGTSMDVDKDMQVDEEDSTEKEDDQQNDTGNATQDDTNEIISLLEDDNKENVDETSSILEMLVKSDIPSKQIKRQMDEALDKENTNKKQKMGADDTAATATATGGGDEKKKLKCLTNFQKFMFDRNLRRLTREDLEMFCIQKMTECMVQRGEIADLHFKIKAQDQLLELLRTETMALGKATRDLDTIHKKVMTDIKKMKDNSNYRFVVPKITRSVGLQAIIRGDNNNKSNVNNAGNKIPTIISKNPRSSGGATMANTKQQTPPAKKQATTNTRTIKPKPPPPGLLPATTARKSTDNIPKPLPTPAGTTTTTTIKPTNTTATNSSPMMTKTLAAVTVATPTIDLTDEDDKVPPPSTPATKVNFFNAKNHNLVVLPNGKPVMVKLAPSPSNLHNQGSKSVLKTTTNSGVRTLPTTSVLRPVTQPLRALLPSVKRTPPQQNNFKLVRHPAPLPPAPPAKDIPANIAAQVPPRPQLNINRTTCGTGIVLSWKMPETHDPYATVASYQLYAYQETKSLPKTESWGRIGDVKALELPMAVTLTQFAVGNRYYFAVRPIDIYNRYGQFSEYKTILL